MTSLNALTAAAAAAASPAPVLSRRARPPPPRVDHARRAKRVVPGDEHDHERRRRRRQRHRRARRRRRATHQRADKFFASSSLRDPFFVRNAPSLKTRPRSRRVEARWRPNRPRPRRRRPLGTGSSSISFGTPRAPRVFAPRRAPPPRRSVSPSPAFQRGEYGLQPLARGRRRRLRRNRLPPDAAAEPAGARRVPRRGGRGGDARRGDVSGCRPARIRSRRAQRRVRFGGTPGETPLERHRRCPW